MNLVPQNYTLKNGYNGKCYIYLTTIFFKYRVGKIWTRKILQSIYLIRTDIQIYKELSTLNNKKISIPIK